MRRTPIVSAVRSRRLIVEQFIEQANEADVAGLIAEGENLKGAYRSGDVDRMLVAKRAFYDRICSGAQNAIAFDIINRLVLRTSVLRRRSLQRRERQAQSIKEVDILLAAIARRDVETARQAALTNVANSAKSALLADERASA